MRRAERQARTREELVDAADRLFSGQGFHVTSLDAVAVAAGYTKGAVYSNFASKEDLFFAVYERRAERFVAEAERAMAETVDEAAAVRGLLAQAAARRGQFGVLTEDADVREFQVVQERDRLRLRLVLRDGADAEARLGERVGARLAALGVAEPRVEVERVAALERPGGKLRMVVAAREPARPV